MTNEELLKAISGMLKTNEDYLNDNPDVFYGIQDRLLKAIDYDEDEDAADEDEVVDEPEKKVSRSGYSDWQPKEQHKYTPEQQEEIEHWMSEGGFSHREAERLANAHDAPQDILSALKGKIHPSEPSSAMLEIMKEIGLDHKRTAAEREGEEADPGRNPQTYAGHRHQKAHKEAHKDFQGEYDKFISELDEKGLRPGAYRKAVKEWEDNWHAENPDAKDQMIDAAEAGKVFNEAGQAREEALQEGALNLITGGAPAGAESTTGEFTGEAAGAGDLKPSTQTAAQMIGGAKGEAGYEAGVEKDPAAIFREQEPEFVEELRRKMADKLDKNPEAKERHDGMPPRDRAPKVIRRTGAASTGRSLSPEEIQAQYGDKYKIKKPGGEQ